VGWRALDKVEKEDIAAILARLAHVPSEAFHTFTSIRSFFEWCIGAALVDKNPCDRLNAPIVPEPKQHVLPLIDLRRVYLGAAEVGYPYGTVLQLLIPTGRRRREIGGLRRPWFSDNERIITLPREITKNKREHVVPVGELTLSVIRGIPHASDYLFPAARECRKGKTTVMSDWGKRKREFDEAFPTSEPWKLHDLRRTASTIWGQTASPSTSMIDC
jgi:integrase